MFLQKLIYQAVRAIISNESSSTGRTQEDITNEIVKYMDKYISNYLNELKIQDLYSLNYTNPSMTDLIVYLIYINEYNKHKYLEELEDLRCDLLQLHESSAVITQKDIYDIVERVIKHYNS